MLFSRGRLLAAIGTVSADGVLALLVTTWVASCAHFLRTGALISLFACAVVAVVGALTDRALLALCLVMPVLLLGGYLYRGRLAKPVIRRLRGTSRRMRVLYGGGDGAPARWPLEEGETVVGRFTRSMRWLLGMEFPPHAGGRRWRLSYRRGGLFRTIEVPFLLWAYWGKRWLKLSLVWAAVLAAGIVALAALQWAMSGPLFGELRAALANSGGDAGWVALATSPRGLQSFVDRADLHLLVSVLILAVCAFQSPAAGLPSFLECVWVALSAGVLLAVFAGVADSLDLRVLAAVARAGDTDPLLPMLAPRQVVTWLEPVALSLGVAGVYNLMKVMDTRIAERG